ncbi:3-oxoacyl-ACP reductase [Streptococcus danieliae]|uniref:3-oxoacyl-ACP reductase n=1 Tax=Streptococcus danieliae TaxID=747656 RepID=A0A7Z0RQ97_9STRE|nr:3-oxoacyl-ACP reductase [Streptococcus danieliae]MBF0716780.1 3-oxoacyl-ACP reductase [Streptococcus danieliae]NYS48710.1 3-oxoacyl-ACP reductase [Streptococcus danieliae]
MPRKVLITGVSSGIGLAQARAFLELGDQVYGLDQKPAPDLPGDFHFLQVDLTQDLEAVFSWVDQVDVLLLTAGILDAYTPLLEMSRELWDRVYETNVRVPMEMSRFYLNKMVSVGAGVIITMCSIASHIAGGGGAAYTSSKHALMGLTKQMALDYAGSGVQIFGIAPGAVQTGMTQADFEPGGLAEWVAQETPIQRWTQPEEVANLTVFLASGKMASMQGVIVTIDGGWTLK